MGTSGGGAPIAGAPAWGRRRSAGKQPAGKVLSHAANRLDCFIDQAATIAAGVAGAAAQR